MRKPKLVLRSRDLQVSCHAHPKGCKVHYESGKKVYLPAELIPKHLLPKTHQTERKSFNGLRVNPEQDKGTPAQQALYHLVIYGLASIPDRQRARLNEKEQKVLREFFTSCARALNRFKNEVLDRDMKLLTKQFYLPPLRELFKLDCSEAYDEPNDMTFSFLGITRRDILARIESLGLVTPQVLGLLARVAPPPTPAPGPARPSY